jgi:hypothetical protein
MPDREKVIKAFEICDNNEDGIVCKNCPYKEDKWNGAWEDETGKTCFQTLHADVLALLKEQEAVKPYIDIDEAKCPICKVKLTRQELIGDNVLYEDFFDYCPHCGKAVKWDD